MLPATGGAKVSFYDKPEENGIFLLSLSSIYRFTVVCSLEFQLLLRFHLPTVSLVILAEVLSGVSISHSTILITV